MRATTSTMMGMTCSLWGVMQCWGVYFGALSFKDDAGGQP
jgi:hypothetical protein